MKDLGVMLVFSGEKLVSLQAFSVVDNGKTFVSRAGRTLPEFRRRGIGGQLSQLIDDFVPKQYPSVWQKRFSTGNNSYPAKKLVQLDILSCSVEMATFSAGPRDEFGRNSVLLNRLSMRCNLLTTCSPEIVPR